MWELRAILLLLPVMAQCNFVDNVMHPDPTPIYDEVILNSEVMADMAASPRYGARYPSPSEISIGAGYTIKFEENKKVLYKSSVKCEQNTLAELVISHINEERGTSTSRIGTTFSENYGLHMSPDRSFQFYKRVVYPDSDEDEAGVQSTEETAHLDKRYGFRCTNKSEGAPKTCGNKVKSGNPINSAHNCPGKGYECTFPQGPNGEDYGICCYSISTATSCGFEGGYCFLDKVKDTCGKDCLN
jgi:hypothetical protein